MRKLIYQVNFIFKRERRLVQLGISRDQKRTKKNAFSMRLKWELLIIQKCVILSYNYTKILRLHNLNLPK